MNSVEIEVSKTAAETEAVKAEEQVKKDKLNEIEAAILRSNEIIDCNETDKIEVPVSEFTITEADLVPDILFKKFARNLEKIQDLAVKYLKSVTPAPQLVVSHKPPIPRRHRRSI